MQGSVLSSCRHPLGGLTTYPLWMEGGCSTCYNLLVTPKSVGKKTAVLCGYSGHAHVQSSEHSEGLEATFPAEADDSRTQPSGLSSHTVNKHPFHSI